MLQWLMLASDHNPTKNVKTMNHLNKDVFNTCYTMQLIFQTLGIMLLTC